MEENQKFWRKPGAWKLILCAVAGVLLLLGGNFLLGGGQKDPENKESNPSAAEELRAYTEKLEAEMAALCTEVNGVGRVSIAVTLSGGFTYCYAKNSQTTSGGTVSSTYVTVGSGSSEGTVYLSVTPPAIAGIGVVCDGGGIAGVRREVIGLLSAAYGIGSNKIYVTGRNPE